MPGVITLDLVGEIAPIRGDTYVHVLDFKDSDGALIDMWTGSPVWKCEFRNNTNTLLVTASVVQGATAGEIQIEAAFPASLSRAEIGKKLWSWDLERTMAGLVTTVIGGAAEIKPDVSNRTGP